MTMRPEQNNLEEHGIRDLRTELRRNKGQPADTVMKSMSLHLKTSDDHLEAPTDMREG